MLLAKADLRLGSLTGECCLKYTRVKGFERRKHWVQILVVDPKPTRIPSVETVRVDF